MRVLVVSQYYRPEPGATQNRLGSFVDGLVDAGHEVTVVCEQPNHPVGVFQQGYGRRPLMTQRERGATVHRLWVATSPRKSTLRRLGFYGSFSLGAFVTCFVARRPDVIFATSPPLPSALAARWAAALRNIPFVLDVRDLWPAAAEALGELSSPRLLRLLEGAERWLYRGSEAVTATTRPFCRHIDRVAGARLGVHVPNGALDQLVARPADGPPDGIFTVGYAGNIGIAQGLRIVLDAAEQVRDHELRFLLVGDGPVRAQLAQERDRRGLDNVVFRDAVPVDRIGNVVSQCGALLVPLRDHAILDDFVPSKLYDAMAVGRPVIAAVRGEAAAEVRQHGCGLVIAPEDGSALAEASLRLARDPHLAAELGARGRAAAQGLSRSRQAVELERVLRAAVEAAGPRRETST